MWLLYMFSIFWDKFGFSVVVLLGVWEMKGWFRMVFLEGDDKNFVEDGGFVGMEVEEVRIVCLLWGIDVLGKSEEEMKGWLGDWLRLIVVEDLEERRRWMVVLLLMR